MKGEVNWYNNEKGYGFIIGADEEKYFFHISSYNGTEVLRINDLVEFEPADNDRGKTANKITVINIKGSKMVVIGEIRMRVGDIKTYNIAQIPCENFIEEKIKWREDNNRFLDEMEELEGKRPKKSGRRDRYGTLLPDVNYLEAFDRFEDERMRLERTRPRMFSSNQIIRRALVIQLFNNKSFFIFEDIEKWLDKLDEMFEIK